MARQSKTWWGQRFLRALEGIMDSGRLSRGRSYAAPHRRVRFGIKRGIITAKMKGNINHYFGVYKTPYYQVEVKLRQIPRERWNRILPKLGSNAEWVTHLILGEVPPTIDTAFKGTGTGLLPRTGTEIQSKCSCPDWANPCKHVAGAYYHVASLLDREPLLLFELRGMQRSTLLRTVAKSEFGRALLGDAPAKAAPKVAVAVQSPRFPAVKTRVGSAEPADPRTFWSGRPLPKDSAADRQVPPVSALLLRRNGDYPEFWNRENSFIEAMAGIYERVAKQLPKERHDGLPFDD